MLNKFLINEDVENKKSLNISVNPNFVEKLSLFIFILKNLANQIMAFFPHPFINKKIQFFGVY